MPGVAKKGRKRPVRLNSAFSRIVALIPLTVFSVGSHLDLDQRSSLVERNVWAMGTRLSVEVEARDHETALVASEAAIREITEVEGRLSTWIDDSELSQLNSMNPGSVLSISPELEADLRMATFWWEETGGAFDPGIASLIAAWDVRGGGREPSFAQLQSARAAAGLGHLRLDTGLAGIATAGFGIEEGAFGKGIGLSRATDAALASGADCVILDFGGQISVAGACGELRIDIADPDEREDRIAVLRIRSGSIATSGNSERGLVVNGVPRGHLLDPRTGTPAPDWGTVSVLAPDPVAADCLSTALYIMGPEAGLEWLGEWPEIDAVFIERIGKATRITATPGLNDRLNTPMGHLRYLRQDQTPAD